jgi:hypothetical protein
VHPLGLVLLGAIAIAGLLWIQSKPRKQRRQAYIRFATVMAMVMLIYLAVTGRLHWLGAVVAALLPFLRRILPLILRALPFLNHLRRQRSSSTQSAGNRSEVQTAVIRMTLDHDSGVMYGTVLTGPLEGRELGNLSEQEFIELLRYCREQDQESARLLEAYLDKRFGDSWRQDDPGQTPPQQESTMNREEALQILGLSAGASREEIIEAHRRLMQRLHPDRGGSDYLAAKINQAKDLLL